MLNKYCDQAWTYHQEALANYGLEYVPTVAPSINPTITNSTSTNYVIDKDAQFFCGALQCGTEGFRKQKAGDTRFIQRLECREDK
jgi:hypothetical protein